MAEPFNGILVVTINGTTMNCTTREILEAYKTGTIVIFRWPDGPDNYPGALLKVTEPEGLITNYGVEIWTTVVDVESESGYGVGTASFEAENLDSYPVLAD